MKKNRSNSFIALLSAFGTMAKRIWKGGRTINSMLIMAMVCGTIAHQARVSAGVVWIGSLAILLPPRPCPLPGECLYQPDRCCFIRGCSGSDVGKKTVSITSPKAGTGQ